MMMMFYRRRASPKHRNDMTEVEYGGGGHRTWLRNDHEDQLVCLEVPLPLYIKEWRRGRGSAPMARPGGALLPPGVGFLPFHVVEVADKEEGEGREGRRGRRPSPYSN